MTTKKLQYTQHEVPALPCPNCGAIFDSRAVIDTIAYWDSVDDIRCAACKADCRVSTEVLRNVSVELIEPALGPQTASESVKRSLWYIETGGNCLTISTTDAKKAAAIALIKLHNTRQPIGQVVSVSRHGFGIARPDDLFFSTEKVLQKMREDCETIPEPSQPPTAEPPTRKLSDDAAQDLRAFLAAFVSAWDSIYQVPTNPYLPMSSLYVQAKSLAKQIEA